MHHGFTWPQAIVILAGAAIAMITLLIWRDRWFERRLQDEERPRGFEVIAKPERTAPEARKD